MPNDRKKAEAPRQLVPTLRELQGDKSQRTFARELGIAVPRLNEVLRKKKRGFSVRDATRVSKALKLPLELCLLGRAA